MFFLFFRLDHHQLALKRHPTPTMMNLMWYRIEQNRPLDRSSAVTTIIVCRYRIVFLEFPLLIEFDFQLCSIIARRDGPAQFLFAKATNKNTTIVFGRKFRISELRSIDQCSNCCTASASLQSIRRCGTTAKNQSVPTTSSTGTYHITLLFHFTNIQMHRLQTDTNSIWKHLGSVHQSIETTTIPSHLEPGSMDALQHE